MKIGVLGTGIVGRTHAAKLSELGHDVFIGTGNIAKTMNEKESDRMGNPPFSVWIRKNSKVELVSFADAAKHGEIIFEGLNGAAALDVLKKIEANLENKILIEISNPLDFSKGMPPTLFVSNIDSLGEQIQRALPKTKVIKAFNTMRADVQVNPKLVANGDHHVLMCGNDSQAKARVTKIMKEWYGWKNIIDLGDITASRGMEMYLPLWLRLMGAMKNPIFNIKIAE